MASEEEAGICAQIAEIVQDFRASEIESRTPGHVSSFLDDVNGVCEWMNVDDRLNFLSGLRSAFARHYWSRSRIVGAITDSRPSLAAEDPLFLFVQSTDSSQSRLLTEVHGERTDGEVGEWDPSRTLIYVDDATFTGRQLAGDLNYLAGLFENAPRHSRNLVVWHVLEYSNEINERLKSPLARLERQGVRVTFEATSTGVRDPRSGALDVLLPDERCAELLRVQRFLKSSSRFSHMLANRDFWRDPSIQFDDRVFDSLAERQIVERVLLEVGCYLRPVTMSWQAQWRPLGFVDDWHTPSMGFGSMFCTYMNSSNTSPMALWWGDPSLGFSTGPSRWNPLLPRRFPK